MYLHDDAALFEEALLSTAAEFSMSEEFIAKDYWAMTMLAEVMKRSIIFSSGCLSGDIPARQSRHIYDLHKLLGMVSLDDEMRCLMDTVRAQRVGGYGNPSADDGVDLSVVLEEIVVKESYKSDYERITMPLLYEDVTYDEAVSALREIAAFLAYGAE